METYGIIILSAVILFCYVLHRRYKKKLEEQQHRAEQIKRWLQE